jgi:hypothetical protein
MLVYAKGGGGGDILMKYESLIVVPVMIMISGM